MEKRGLADIQDIAAFCFVQALGSMEDGVWSTELACLDV